MSNWHPIASSTDLALRHVYHAKLEGQELAAWRADDGHVNIWQNRCLHRGVRLSIGLNDGSELKCQYHGWRYANRTAGCTYIPAHPENAPARRVTNKRFANIERHGLVWASLGQEEDFAGLPEGDWTPLRAVPVRAPAHAVMDHLAGETLWDLALRLDIGDDRLIVIVQPLDEHASVIRALRDGAPDDAALRRLNRILTTLRDRIEAGATP
jgi:phenylpropionate dioxygenase-like ring-hydroxylating dioxygenase large terminal subunit